MMTQHFTSPFIANYEPPTTAAAAKREAARRNRQAREARARRDRERDEMVAQIQADTARHGRSKASGAAQTASPIGGWARAFRAARGGR